MAAFVLKDHELEIPEPGKVGGRRPGDHDTGRPTRALTRNTQTETEDHENHALHGRNGTPE